MPIPVVTQPTTPRYIAAGVAIPTLSIVGSNTPTSYAATPLPAGLSVNTSTGAITGTPTAAGSTTTSITATNGSGASAAVTLTWEVQASPDGIGGYSDLEVDFDLVSREVTIPGVATDGAVFPLVTRDRMNLLVGFKKWGVLQSLAGGGTIGLGFALSEFEPDGSLTLTDAEPTEVGSGSTTRYRLPIAISRTAWDTLSGYEGDTSTALIANAEIEVSVGTTMRLTSKPFGVHLERDWMAAAAVPVISVAPVITGTDVVVGTLWTCTTGTWTGVVASYTYQWYNAGVAIGAATASTYTLQAGDEGDLITCQVTANNALGSSVASESNSITPTTYTRTAFLSSTGGTGFLGDNTRPYNSVSNAVTALHAAYPASTVTLRLLDSPALGGSVEISTISNRLTVKAHAATPYTLNTELTISAASASAASVTLDRVVATITYAANTAGSLPSAGTIYGLNSATLTLTANGSNRGAQASAPAFYDAIGPAGSPGSNGDPPTDGTNGNDGSLGVTGSAGDVGLAGYSAYAITLSGSLSASGTLTGGNGQQGQNGQAVDARGGTGGRGGDSTSVGNQNGGAGGLGGAGGTATGGAGGSGGNGGQGGSVTLASGATDGGLSVAGGSAGSAGSGGTTTVTGGAGGLGGTGAGSGSTGATGAAGANGTGTTGSNGSAGSAGSNGSIV